MKKETGTYSALEKKDQHENRGSVRYILSAVLFMNCFLLYAMRLNLSVSITAMVNSTNTDIIPLPNESCRDPYVSVNNGTAADTDNKQGEFDWDQTQQAMITYTFFVGYVIIQIPGGFLAETYSVKWVLGLGMGITSLLTCFTSIVARASFPGLLALRVLEGLSEGVVFPCVYAFTSRWIPVQEQGLLLNFIASGCSIGTVVTMPVTAMLCDSVLGWPASFYLFGILGLVVSVLWLVMSADTPEDHRWISPAERDYIIQNRPQTSRKLTDSVPWGSLLLSPPVLLLGLQQLGGSINLYLILTEFPSYLKYMFGIDTLVNGFATGGLTLGCSISVVLSGWAADKILVKGIVSKNTLRKFCIAVSCILPALCMAIIPQIGCRYEMILALTLFNCVCMGVSGGGDRLVPLDLAPAYAGTVQGVVNCIASAAGVVGPGLVGFMTEKNNTLHQWNLVFYCVAVAAATGASAFIIFGSVEEQKWAKVKEHDEDFPVLGVNGVDD